MIKCSRQTEVYRLDVTVLNKIFVQSQLYELLQVQHTPTAQRCISPVQSQYQYSMRKANSSVSYAYDYRN